MLRNRVNAKQSKTVKLEYVILAAIVALGAVLTYYPHFSYPFPLHVDEWYHIYIAQYIAQHGSLSPTDIYLRTFPFPDLEKGYHIMLAGVYDVFHPSITQWIYLPTIIDVIAILSVFVFVYKLLGRNEALVSALLVALMPSNVTIEGPVFLIPADLSLIFIPLVLLFAFDLLKKKPIYNYAAVFLITTFMLYAHPPSAIVIMVIIGLYALLNIRSNSMDERMHSKLLIATLILSAFASVPNFLSYLTINAGIVNALSFSFFIYLNQIPLVYGILPSIFFIVGFYLFSDGKDKRMLSLLLTAVFLLFTITLFANFNVNFLIPYQRVYIPLFLIMAVVGSAGYVKLLSLSRFGKYIGIAAFLILLALTIYFAVINDINTPYYHIINNTQYQNFLWIKNNLNNNATVLLNPWLAKAFGPITGMKVYSVIPFGPSAPYEVLINNTDAFFAGNCTNTSFLRTNNISIIYTNSTCINTNITRVANYTYIVDKNITSRVTRG